MRAGCIAFSIVAPGSIRSICNGAPPTRCSARGEIVAPSGLRQLIEAVHGEHPAAVPQPLIDAEAKRIDVDAAHANHGRQNTVKLNDGFRSSAGFDDVEYPTRLGEEQRVLVLARRVGDRLVPWAGGRGVEAWMLSEVSASARRLFRVPLPDQSRPKSSRPPAIGPNGNAAPSASAKSASDGSIRTACATTRSSA